MLITEYWARWLGMELNDYKLEESLSSTRHLGFAVGLEKNPGSHY